jgi:hypothetical protein
MEFLEQMTPDARISGAWCNSNLAISAFLEAMSFATPPLERFFIQTVCDAARQWPDPTMKSRAYDFVQEEARHSRAHRKFNLALSCYLGARPPGLQQIEWLLDRATRRLSKRTRLVSVEAMENVSEMLSAGYLRYEHGAAIDCPFARHLFAQHAREEIGHAAVIHDLLAPPRRSSRLIKAAAYAIAATAAAAYFAVAVPWIILRKLSARRLGKESIE